jgi:hypothetical protein
MAAAVHPAPPQLPERYESLAAAERGFAAAGLRAGVRKSFLAHFAPDATIFRPFAVCAPGRFDSAGGCTLTADLSVAAR